MEDVLAVYTRPRDPDHPLVCLDETSKQLDRRDARADPDEAGAAGPRRLRVRSNGTANWRGGAVGWRLLTSAVRSALPRDTLSRRSDTEQISWGKFSRLPCTVAELRFAPLMDIDFAVSRPLVRRSRLVSGSCPSTRTFVPRFLQTSPRGDSPCVLTSPSPPSGRAEDFHLQAAEHAQHTACPLRGCHQISSGGKRARRSAGRNLQRQVGQKNKQTSSKSIAARRCRCPMGGCPKSGSSGIFRSTASRLPSGQIHKSNHGASPTEETIDSGRSFISLLPVKRH